MEEDIQTTIKRNKRFVYEVLKRDMHLCRCCGFYGEEVHHIVPLCMGGKDDITNMITLCHTCHKDAPNTLESFKEYMSRGGSKLFKIVGSIVIDMEQKGIPYSTYYPLMLNIIKALRQVDINNAIEEYGIKESLNIKDISFV